MPFATSLDDWQVTELFQPDRFRHQRKSYGEYRLVLSHTVPVGEDAGSAFIHGCFLARQLDRVWTYSTGLPFGARAYDQFLTPTNPPLEWTSNAQEALSADEWSLLQSRISYQFQFRTMPRLPLRATVDAMEAVAVSGELVEQLCSYHFESLSTTEGDVHFLLLAQGLEIVREIISGGTTEAKQKSLPPKVAARFHRDLNWLFEMMQQRRQTRHSIEKRGAVTLKTPFTAEEESDYLHDGNLIIQYVVSEQLKIPLVWNDQGETIEILRPQP